MPNNPPAAVDHPAVAARNVLLRPVQCLVSTAARTKAEARIRERRIEQRPMHLQQGLLNQSVEPPRADYFESIEC